MEQDMDALREWPVGGFYMRRKRQAEELIARREQHPDVIDGSSLPRELSPHGMLVHIMNEEISPKFNTAEAFILEIEPGGHSGKHRHMCEEFIYVLEGEGYDLHWEVEAEIQDSYSWRVAERAERYDWREGDCIFIPVNTVHQHVNTNPNRRARLYCVTSRLYAAVGFPEVEDLEVASAYKAWLQRAAAKGVDGPPTK